MPACPPHGLGSQGLLLFAGPAAACGPTPVSVDRLPTTSLASEMLIYPKNLSGAPLPIFTDASWSSIEHGPGHPGSSGLYFPTMPRCYLSSKTVHHSALTLWAFACTVHSTRNDPPPLSACLKLSHLQGTSSRKPASTAPTKTLPTLNSMACCVFLSVHSHSRQSTTQGWT